MINSNKKIIESLKINSGNAAAVKSDLSMWDHTDKFPESNLLMLIKMHQWKYEDFDYTMEKLIRNVLPEFMLKVFFELKEFRSNKRNELASTCAVLSKIKGYPMQTQDDKAFCLYEYSLEKYYKGGNNESGKSES